MRLKTQKVLATIILGVCVFGVGIVHSATLATNASVTDWIRSDLPANTGSDGIILIGSTSSNGGGSIRGVIAFDVSSIASGSTINSVSVTMTGQAAGTGSATNVDFELYELTSAFTSSATWNTSDGSTSWSTAGGDFNATLLSSFTANLPGAASTTYNLGDSAAFQSAVSSAVNGSGTLSLILRAPSLEGTDTQSFLRFGGFTDATTPSISIDYTAVPEPSTYAMLVLGAGILVGLRRLKK